jgi:AcrR family transcriptional regulator
LGLVTVKRSQPSAAPTPIAVGAAEGCDLLIFKNTLTKENDRSTVRHMNDITCNDTRDIILDVTEKLIYKSGIAATGMDLLVKTAGVSRKSIYRYFANKEELTVAALQRRDVRWMLWFKTEVDKAATPADRLLNLFTVLKAWFDSEGFRGCAFINTSGETGDPQDPVRRVAKVHKQKLLDYVCELCTEHGSTDPHALAKQLLILIDGAITVALVMGDHRAADNAHCMARKLLDL